MVTSQLAESPYDFNDKVTAPRQVTFWLELCAVYFPAGGVLARVVAFTQEAKLNFLLSLTASSKATPYCFNNKTAADTQLFTCMRLCCPSVGAVFVHIYEPPGSCATACGYWVRAGRPGLVR